MHNLSVATGFPAGQRAWAIYTAVTFVAFSVAAELAFRGFGHTTGLGPTAGLFERIAGTIAFTWITTLAVDLGRASRA